MDLLRPLRARAWVIAVTIAIAVLVSLGWSAIEKQKYTATASFQVQGEAQDLGLVGVSVAQLLTPAQLASQAAQTISQPNVADHAKALLGSPLAPGQLSSSVTASVNTNAANVQVQATEPTANEAAQVANAFATAAVEAVNQNQRTAYAASARQLAKLAPHNADPLYNSQLENLRELAAIAAPAQLTTRASPPGTPSSPRPIRNGLLAGVLGLLVGLLVVYVWDSVDRRLRSSDEVERQFGYEVLGRVREEALGHSPIAEERERAVEPVDWEQFRILQRNLEFMRINGGPRAADGPRMIAVTSAIPEEGKTTVACFLAFAAAASGKRTLLIECDLRRPVLAERLSIQAAPGVTDFVNGTAAPADLIQVVPFNDVAVRNGAAIRQPEARESVASALPYTRQLVCVTAGTPTDHPVEVLGSAAVRTMLEQARREYDLLVLDTPPVLAVVDALEVIDRAEAIIVCGRAAKLTRDQARAGKQALNRISDRPIGLVVTGISPSSDRDYGYYRYYSYSR